MMDCGIGVETGGIWCNGDVVVEKWRLVLGCGNGNGTYGMVGCGNGVETGGIWCKGGGVVEKERLVSDKGGRGAGGCGGD